MTITIDGSVGITYPAGGVQQGPLTIMTAQASTSGTEVLFTGIPSWVKRITMMFNGVSTNGSSNPLIQIGAGSITSSGYTSGSINGANASSISGSSSTAGFIFASGSATNILYGNIIINTLGSNVWVASHVLTFNSSGTYYSVVGGGAVTLSGTLDRIRATTVNGTDAFDAGSVNVLYE